MADLLRHLEDLIPLRVKNAQVDKRHRAVHHVDRIRVIVLHLKVLAGELEVLGEGVHLRRLRGREGQRRAGLAKLLDAVAQPVLEEENVGVVAQVPGRIRTEVLHRRVGRLGQPLADEALQEGIADEADLAAGFEIKIDVLPTQVGAKDQRVVGRADEPPQPARAQRRLNVLEHLVKFADIALAVKGEHRGGVRHGGVVLRGAHHEDGDANNQHDRACRDAKGVPIGQRADRHTGNGEKRADDAVSPHAVLQGCRKLLISLIALLDAVRHRAHLLRRALERRTDAPEPRKPAEERRQQPEEKQDRHRVPERRAGDNVLDRPENAHQQAGDRKTKPDFFHVQIPHFRKLPQDL